MSDETTHQRLIRELCESDIAIKTKGFQKALRAALADNWPDTKRCDSACLHVRPDAWKRVASDHGDYWFELYEVEITHPLTDRQLETYGDLFWALDELWCGYDLIRIDRMGHRCVHSGAVIGIALSKAYVEGILISDAIIDVDKEFSEGGLAPETVKRMGLLMSREAAVVTDDR